MTEDHGFPDREHAAERYLLGDMSAADRERYEEHFFSCAECAEDVRTTATFLEDVRKHVVPRFPAQTATVVPVSPAVATRAAWYRPMVPWAVAASLLLVTASQTFVLLSRDETRVLYAVTLRPESRGPAAILIRTANLKDGVVLAVDINEVQEGVILEYKMTTPGGREIASRTTSAPPAGEALPLLFTRSELRELGRYTLVIREAATGREIDVYPFVREN